MWQITRLRNTNEEEVDDELFSLACGVKRMSAVKMSSVKRSACEKLFLTAHMTNL
jgi:hypothetical protein